MPRKNSRQIRPDVPRPAAQQVHRAITVMVDLCKDGTSTAVVGVLNPSTHRYHFVRMADREWGGLPGSAMAEMLAEVAYAVGADEETRRLLR